MMLKRVGIRRVSRVLSSLDDWQATIIRAELKAELARKVRPNGTVIANQIKNREPLRSIRRRSVPRRISGAEETAFAVQTPRTDSVASHGHSSILPDGRFLGTIEIPDELVYQACNVDSLGRLLFVVCDNP
jgi:hypothetical protein